MEYLRIDHIRKAGTKDRPLFAAKDVCAAFEINKYREVLKRVPLEEKSFSRVRTTRGPQKMLMLTEAGLYRLIFQSKSYEARRFREWVITQILLQARQSGLFRWLEDAFGDSMNDEKDSAVPGNEDWHLLGFGLGSEPDSPEETSAKETVSGDPTLNGGPSGDSPCKDLTSQAVFPRE